MAPFHVEGVGIVLLQDLYVLRWKIEHPGNRPHEVLVFGYIPRRVRPIIKIRNPLNEVEGVTVGSPSAPLLVRPRDVPDLP